MIAPKAKDPARVIVNVAIVELGPPCGGEVAVGLVLEAGNEVVAVCPEGLDNAECFDETVINMLHRKNRIKSLHKPTDFPHVRTIIHGLAVTLKPLAEIDEARR